MKNEDIRNEGTDLNTVLMSEADKHPLEIELPDDVATMQQRITEASSGEARPEVGVPLSEQNESESREIKILLSINKYLFGITILLGTLVVVSMTTMIITSVGLR